MVSGGWMKSYLHTRIGRSRCDGCHTSVQSLLSSHFSLSLFIFISLHLHLSLSFIFISLFFISLSSPLSLFIFISLFTHRNGNNQTTDSTNKERSCTSQERAINLSILAVSKPGVVSKNATDATPGGALPEPTNITCP